MGDATSHTRLIVDLEREGAVIAPSADPHRFILSAFGGKTLTHKVTLDLPEEAVESLLQTLAEDDYPDAQPGQSRRDSAYAALLFAVIETIDSQLATLTALRITEQGVEASTARKAPRTLDGVGPYEWVASPPDA
jgi:hypothetical protein